jgi:two-component system, NarL family, sensor kinase
MGHWSLVALALLSTAVVFAQAPPSKARVAELNGRSFELRQDHPDSSRALAREAIAMAREIGDTIGLALGYKRIGLVMSRQGVLDSALSYYRQALTLEQKVGHRKGIMGTAQNMAEVFRKRGQLAQARDMYLVALDMANALEDDAAKALAYNALGAVHEQLGDMEKAVECLFNSLEISKRLDDRSGLRGSYYNLAHLYFEFDRLDKAHEYYTAYMAECRKESSAAELAKGYSGLGIVHQNEPARSILYHDSALVILRRSQNLMGQSDALANIGSHHITLGNYASARRELQEAVAIARKADYPKGLGFSLRMLGRLDRLQGDRRAGDLHLQEAVSVLEAAGHRTELAKALDDLSRLRQDEGRLDEALVLVQRGQRLQDSIMGEKQVEQWALAEMREKYDAELRLSEIQELRAAKALEEQQKRSNMWQRNAMIGLAVLLLAGVFLLWRNLGHRKRLAKQDTDLYEQRINDMLRQHEIRTLDATMEGQERERQRIAHDLHDRLGSMLSSVKLQFEALGSRGERVQHDEGQQYRKVFGLLDDAVAEVRRISHDMERSSLADFGLKGALEDLRKTLEVPGQLDVEMSFFGLEERLDRRVELTTYRIVQECVSNALKHARARSLSIQVMRSNDSVNLIVEDDGVGFDPAQTSNGMGLGNMQRRATEVGGTVVVDAKPGRGTSISVDIPLPPIT